MSDEFDKALEVDVLAAMLRADQRQSADLVETLAIKMEGALPDHTSVVWGSSFFSSKKTVKELVVTFDGARLKLVKNKHGVVTQELKVVRDVVLKTTDVSMDDWINKLAQELSKLAGKNANARAALTSFFIGQTDAF